MVLKKRIIAFFLIVIVMAATFGLTTKGIMKETRLGLDLQGGFEVLYHVESADPNLKVDQNLLDATVAALDRRVNALGVNEPNISIEDDNIRVQLAGVDDAEKARTMLSTEANLTFRDYQDNIVLDGQDLTPGGAMVGFDQNNQVIIEMALKDGKKFGEVTEKIAQIPFPNNIMAIWLDFEEGVDSYEAESLKGENEQKYISAPSVNYKIDSNKATISGSFTSEEANELAAILNAGALPAKLTEEYSTSVGAKFGEDALNETMLAGLIALIAVFIFMTYFYRFPGFLASIALTAYCFLMLLIFNMINGVLTLPGIAALILGIGIAVDANIITDERLKDELRKGRPMKAAYREANKHSIGAIIDAHLTTLLVGFVLFTYGTSSVRGFATMLIISVIVGFVTAVFGRRGLMHLWVSSNFLNNRLGWVGVKPESVMKLKDIDNDLDIPTRYDRFDFIKPRMKFFVASLIVTAAGIASLFVMGMNAGIDFSSGSRIEVNSDQKIEVADVKKKFEQLELSTEDIIVAGEGNTVVVRVKNTLDQQEDLALRAALMETFGKEPNISTVSPTVGKALFKNALMAVAVASLGIILYVTIRFEWRIAIAVITALLHAAFVTITIFSLFRIEVDITFIAAVLTILGYSINDTIITFDRIRENFKKVKRIKSREELARIVNISVRQTLKRSINTVVVTILTVVAMMVFGSQSIFYFNLALLIGLIVGIYSTIFTAAPLFYVLKGQELDKKGSLKTLKVKRNEEGTV